MITGKMIIIGIFIVAFIAFIFCLLFISKSGDDEENENCDKNSQCVGCPFCGGDK